MLLINEGVSPLVRIPAVTVVIRVPDLHVYISVKLQVTIKSRDLTFFLAKH